MSSPSSNGHCMGPADLTLPFVEGNVSEAICALHVSRPCTSAPHLSDTSGWFTDTLCTTLTPAHLAKLPRNPLWGFAMAETTLRCQGRKHAGLEADDGSAGLVIVLLNVERGQTKARCCHTQWAGRDRWCLIAVTQAQSVVCTNAMGTCEGFTSFASLFSTTSISSPEQPGNNACHS